MFILAVPSPLLGGEERIGAGGMIGDVDDSYNIGNALTERRLDTLPERHLRHTAALTSALEAKADPSLIGALDDDMAAMSSDHRVDVRIDDLQDPFTDSVPTLLRRTLARRRNKSHPADFRNGGAQLGLDPGDQGKDCAWGSGELEDRDSTLD
jgi:hypothetical protein